MHFRTNVVVVLAVVAAGPALAGPADELYRLEEQLAEAQEKHAAGNNGGVLGKKDLRLGVLKKMDALARKHADHAEGAEVAVGTFTWSWNLDLDLEGLNGRFDQIVDRHPNAEELEDILPMMGAIGSAVGSPAVWVDDLDRLARTTKRADTRLAAWMAAGQILMKSGKLEPAKGRFRQVLSDAPKESDSATFAKGYIFEIEHLQVGMKAPDFSTTGIDGETVTLSSFRGRVVLLDFWATWCPGCVAKISDLRKATEKLDGQPFVILAISLDEDRVGLKRFLKRADFPAVHTWEKLGLENAVGMLYNANELPTTFLIDQEGVIRARDPDPEELPRLVRELVR